MSRKITQINKKGAGNPGNKLRKPVNKAKESPKLEEIVEKQPDSWAKRCMLD